MRWCAACSRLLFWAHRYAVGHPWPPRNTQPTLLYPRNQIKTSVTRKTPRTLATRSLAQGRGGLSIFFPSRSRLASANTGSSGGTTPAISKQKTGRRFGYQLTFFRVGVYRQPLNPSRWAVRDLYMAHFAISDIDRESFHSFERINRAGVRLGGRRRIAALPGVERGLGVTNRGRRALLRAKEEDFELALELDANKAEVMHGENGDQPERRGRRQCLALLLADPASRLRGGSSVGRRSFDVTGMSWMDHEFGTSFLEDRPDRLGLVFDSTGGRT